MHISRVELENFKSHANAAFEFSCGTTSITGENGAGKTSIIEAIAWTIFDTLDYKKEDIVRRGTKKGIARVTFESGLDEREYTVYRDTGNGYYVFDPALKARIADKKEEVTRFLWQHLGIEPGTDLESLFRHAIGVPQGTFTAIFLATAAERKKTFDGLLKVEEYRRSSDELRKTVRFVENQIAEVNVKIARAEGEIGRIDQVEAEQKTLRAQIADWTAKCEKLAAEADEKEQSIARLDAIELRLGELYTAAERHRAEMAQAEIVLKHRESEVARSREAVSLVAEVRNDAKAHQNTLGRLKELERERGERQNLRDELTKIESALSAVVTERKHLVQELEKIQKARSEVAALGEAAEVQGKLELELAALRRQQVKAEGARDQLGKLEERIISLRAAYREASDELSAAREKVAGSTQLEFLQTRDAELVRELANANAALERDERFQREIKNGLCPILSAKCLNLQEGQTLESFVSSQFGELRMRIDVLVTEQAKVGDELREAREAERFGAQISVMEKRVQEIGEEGSRLKSQNAELETEAARLDETLAKIEEVERDLNRLDNPKAKISYLEKETSREGSVREGISESERNIERLESDRRITVEKLEVYKDLDHMFEQATAERDRTAEANRIFVANEALASHAEANESALEKAKDEFAKAAEASAAADREMQAATGEYDRDGHLRERAAMVDIQKSQAEATALLSAAKKRSDDLEKELERLYGVKRSMQEEFRERERLQKVAETTEFIRTTLREAAPLVARNYVHHVSLEANQMFREIRGSAECSLKWTEDYGICLEENGYDRPFQSLSGGEQMSAALSVRLALLKQLSGIHVAFFDEPTMNMDAERRENLAQQIGRISHFDQLFVISHDDTFEGYMDHEIRVGA